ncbi:hypothetical protein J6TS1_42420 [Siminovitchia terrae]|uniref:Uncharacterized protein n=1 Tax=Siminovitchia terrae TaxID=1914933 RepID=A0ABQ4L258_SIMTE|nr:hypothetical protein J6TS1_42420 [Siminovitchia terrae]
MIKEMGGLLVNAVIFVCASLMTQPVSKETIEFFPDMVEGLYEDQTPVSLHVGIK